MYRTSGPEAKWPCKCGEDIRLSSVIDERWNYGCVTIHHQMSVVIRAKTFGWTVEGLARTLMERTNATFTRGGRWDGCKWEAAEDV